MSISDLANVYNRHLDKIKILYHSKQKWFIACPNRSKLDGQQQLCRLAFINTFYQLWNLSITFGYQNEYSHKQALIKPVHLEVF